MHRTSRVFAGITAFFYIGILSGCASLSITVRDFLREKEPAINAVTSAKTLPRSDKTISAQNHIPTIVVIVGFLNKPPDADMKDTNFKQLEQKNAPQAQHLTPAVYYGVIADPHVQGNRPIKIGTGSIIEASDNRAIILTNDHVQANTDNLTALLSDGRTYPARVLWASHDSSFDIAFLEIKKRNPADPAETFVAAQLGDSDTARTGDRYLMIGHPYGLFYSVHTGTFAQMRHSLFQEGDSILQINMNVYPGNSGSPIINEQGEIDGVVFAVKVDEHNKWVTAIGWAIPINPIKEKFKEIRTGAQ